MTITVSDHAIVRFLERTGRIDVESIKREIVTDQLADQASTLGNGWYPTANGLVAVVKNGTVTTVMVNGGQCRRI